MILALILALGSAAALLIGGFDIPRALRGYCPAEQPILLILLAAAFAWLSFATWPR